MLPHNKQQGQVQCQYWAGVKIGANVRQPLCAQKKAASNARVISLCSKMPELPGPGAFHEMWARITQRGNPEDIIKMPSREG